MAWASSVSCASISRRSLLTCSRRAASVAASVGSSVTSSWKATSVVPMRPAALSRGMSENGSWSAVTVVMSRWAVAARATMPGRRVSLMCSMPSATRALFSSSSSIMSEMVPRVATSV